MKPHTVIKADLFADELLTGTSICCDPLTEIKSHVDFSALAANLDGVAHRPASNPCGRPPSPTEMTTPVPPRKRRAKRCDESMAFQWVKIDFIKHGAQIIDATLDSALKQRWSGEEGTDRARVNQRLTMADAGNTSRGMDADRLDAFEASPTASGFPNALQTKTKRNTPPSECPRWRSNRNGKSKTRVRTAASRTVAPPNFKFLTYS